LPDISAGLTRQDILVLQYQAQLCISIDLNTGKRIMPPDKF